jgi:hypothetical protein
MVGTPDILIQRQSPAVEGEVRAELGADEEQVLVLVVLADRVGDVPLGRSPRCPRSRCGRGRRAEDVGREVALLVVVERREDDVGVVGEACRQAT